jgi:hypothetical protein
MEGNEGEDELLDEGRRFARGAMYIMDRGGVSREIGS